MALHKQFTLIMQYVGRCRVPLHASSNIAQQHATLLRLQKYRMLFIGLKCCTHHVPTSCLWCEIWCPNIRCPNQERLAMLW